MKSLLAASALLALAACVVDDDCRYQETREATFDASGAERVRIQAGAGTLEVTGVPGSEVRAEGLACGSSREILDEVRLEISRAGSTVHVEARMPEQTGSWFDARARLDLSIELPEDLAVELEDSSGTLEVTDVRSLVLDDGSGSTRIARVAGELSIEDGSGSIEVDEVGGDVRLKDGSGSIELREIGGDVDIIEDGSGSIAATSVVGSVRVRRDGSGSITVRDVGGDFTVEDDGSGSIDHDGVQGRVRIPEKD
jgi:hypothetical protein